MQDLIEALRRVLVAGPPMRLAVLFGSFATARARQTSDIDLAVLPEDAALPLSAEATLASELEGALGRPVDLVRLDHASAVLRWQIARDGVLVHEGARGAWTQFRARTAAEHAEIASTLERCTRLFLRRIARPAP